MVKRNIKKVLTVKEDNNNVNPFEIRKIQKKKTSMSNGKNLTIKSKGNHVPVINSKYWTINLSLVNLPTTSSPLPFEMTADDVSPLCVVAETDPSDDFFVNELEPQNLEDINLNMKIKNSTHQKVVKDLNLAFKYHEEKNYEKAYPIFKQNADIGNAEAQLKVGIYLRNRYVNFIDTLQSVKYFKKAALQNLPEAQYIYGTAIINRLAFGEKIDKGLDYLRMAALQGHILAMEDYGQYLKEGKFIEKGDSQGEGWI